MELDSTYLNHANNPIIHNLRKFLIIDNGLNKHFADTHLSYFVYSQKILWAVSK